jgi:hypothetical protein
VTPGRFLHNFQRARGVLNANRIDVVDVYRFDVLQRSLTDISLDVPSGDDFALVLVGVGGRRIGSGGTEEGITVRTKPGRYYLQVRARHGSAGRYRLTRASRIITRTSLHPTPFKSAPGGSVDLRVGVTPSAGGPVTVLVERFDPIAGWQFSRRFERRIGAGGSVSVVYRPPSIGRYRAIATFNGTKVAAGSTSGVRHFRVTEPLRD